MNNFDHNEQERYEEMQAHILDRRSHGSLPHSGMTPLELQACMVQEKPEQKETKS